MKKLKTIGKNLAFCLITTYLAVAGAPSYIYMDGTVCQGVSTGPASGPVSEFPWDRDKEFVEARLRSNTNILMGGYRTVLKDPMPGEEYNVRLAASLLTGIIIVPGGVFSQNQAIGPYTEDKGFKKGPTYFGTTLAETVGGGVCKIASTLYNTAVLSGLRIMERHNHSMPVPYVPYGQDATVAYGYKDMRFKNDTDSNILIWARGIGNTLYIAFYGSKAGPELEWVHEVTNIRKAPVYYRRNTDLKKGEEKQMFEGMDGAVVRSWVKVTAGDKVDVRYMGISDYQPLPFVIERG